MPVNDTKKIDGRGLDAVVTLRRVYANAAVMALKRRFDTVESTRTGLLLRSDYVKDYHKLCPWDDRPLTKAILGAEYDELAKPRPDAAGVTFLDFLVAATLRTPKVLLPDAVLAHINLEVDQACVEDPAASGGSTRDGIRRDHIVEFVKREYSCLEDVSTTLGDPILAEVKNRASHVLGRTSEEKSQTPSHIQRPKTPSMEPNANRHITSVILSTGMLSFDVDPSELEKELQSLPAEIYSRSGVIKPTETFVLKHTQEMAADHLTFETPSELVTALLLICELEQLEPEDAVAWEEKLRASELPGPAYQYVMLLQCDTDAQLEESEIEGPVSLDAIVVPLSEAICASDLFVGGQMVAFFHDVEAELQDMVMELSSERRQKSFVYMGLGHQCFKHIRQMEHEEVRFESAEQLVGTLKLLAMESDPATIESKLKNGNLPQSIQRYVREAASIQHAKGQALSHFADRVAQDISNCDLVGRNATDHSSMETLLKTMLMDTRHLDGQSAQEMLETSRRLTTIIMLHLRDMAHQQLQFQTYGQLISALQFLSTDSVSLELLTHSMIPDPVKRYIKSVDRSEVATEQLRPGATERVVAAKSFGFEMLINNYWAVSAHVDAGMSGVREMVQKMAKLYQQKAGPKEPETSANGTLTPLAFRIGLAGPSSRRTPGKADDSSVAGGKTKIPHEDDTDESNLSSQDQMPHYRRAIELSQAVFREAINVHASFMKGVNTGVIAPLASFLDNQDKNKRKLDEEMRKVEAQLKQQRDKLLEEQKTCEKEWILLRGAINLDLKEGIKDSKTKRTIQAQRAKVAKLFEAHDLNVNQARSFEDMIKQVEIPTKLRELEEMERSRQSIVSTLVDKLALLYQRYLHDLQPCGDLLESTSALLKNNNDMGNAVQYWLSTGKALEEPIQYRLPARPEQVMMSHAYDDDSTTSDTLRFQRKDNPRVEDAFDAPDSHPRAARTNTLVGTERTADSDPDLVIARSGAEHVRTLHAGYLTKKSQSKANKWDSRYFILRENQDTGQKVLVYYHSLEDVPNRKINPEAVKLDHMDHMKKPKSAAVEDTFRVDIKLRTDIRDVTRTELCLRTDSKEQLSVWYNKLLEAGVRVQEEEVVEMRYYEGFETMESVTQITQAQFNSEVVYQGSISKKSSARTTPLHMWQTRWFVLRSNSILYYYSTESDALHLRNPRWLKTEDIQQVLMGDAGKGAKDGVRLSLVMKNSARSWELLATSPLSCQDWFDKLTAVLDDHHKRPHGRPSAMVSAPAPSPRPSSSVNSPVQPISKEAQPSKDPPHKGSGPLLGVPQAVASSNPKMKILPALASPVKTGTEARGAVSMGGDEKKPASAGAGSPSTLGVSVTVATDEPRKSQNGTLGVEPASTPRRSVDGLVRMLRGGKKDSHPHFGTLKEKKNESRASHTRSATEIHLLGVKDEAKMRLADHREDDEQLAVLFDQILDIKDRAPSSFSIFGSKTVKGCFVAKEAIKAMQLQGYETKEALEICNRWLKMGFFVSPDNPPAQEFKDDGRFFQIAHSGGGEETGRPSAQQGPSQPHERGSVTGQHTRLQIDHSGRGSTVDRDLPGRSSTTVPLRTLAEEPMPVKLQKSKEPKESKESRKPPPAPPFPTPVHKLPKEVYAKGPKTPPQPSSGSFGSPVVSTAERDKERNSSGEIDRTKTSLNSVSEERNSPKHDPPSTPPNVAQQESPRLMSYSPTHSTEVEFAFRDDELQPAAQVATCVCPFCGEPLGAYERCLPCSGENPQVEVSVAEDPGR